MARWIPLSNPPGVDVRTLVLGTDGTVLAKPREFHDDWIRLTPDATGSYAAGTWRPMRPMLRQRLGALTRAATLLSGRLLVWGGRSDWMDPSAEIYDPVSDTWSDATPTTIDRNFVAIAGPTTVLPDGRVLVGSNVGASGRPTNSRTAVYDAASSRWAATAFSAGEWGRTWTLLPDGSVLNPFGIPAQQFVPATGNWVSARREPIGSWAVPGPALRLPDGRVWVMFPFPLELSRGHGQLSYYTPATREWDAGPDLPEHVYHGGFSLGASSHNTACLFPDGRVFFQSRRHPLPPGSWGPSELRFYEFDPASGGYDERVPPAPIAADPAAAAYDQFAATLLLPDGTVLVARNGSAFVYDPEPAGRAPRDEWRPIVHHVDGSRTSISLRPGQTYTVYGELFAGVSEGNSHPEGSLATNYPLVRVTYESGTVVYWRTYDHSSRAIAASGVLQTFRFAVPPGARTGDARLSVVTNAIASTGVDAYVGVGNRFWLWQTLFREGGLLFGNLADGGYIIVRPGGIQPVGPWDPTILERLDGAARDLATNTLAVNSDWKRVRELPIGLHVTAALRGGDFHAGTLLRRDEEVMTIDVEGTALTIAREQVMELYTSTPGFLASDLGFTGGPSLGSDVLLYRHPSHDPPKPPPQ